jgi:hypothetical protein
MGIARLNWISQLFLAVMIGVVAASFPLNNLDALGYIGCAAAASGSSDAKVVHDTAYGALSGTPQFSKLTKATEEDAHRVDWYHNQYHFTELLPFYSVKALYVAAIMALHKLGVSWVHAGRVISGIAFIATGVIVTFWLRKYLTGSRSTFLWLGIMLVPTVSQTARLFTPDALCCAFVVFASWLILEQRQCWWGISVALITVWIRPDYLLFTGILAVALWLVRKLTLVEVAIVTGLTCGSYFCLTHFSGNYGWPLLFRHSFMGYLTAPGESVVTTGDVLGNYPHVLLGAIRFELLNSFLLAYYALGGFLLLSCMTPECKAVLASALLFGASHVLVFPSFESRFFGPATIIVSMSLVKLLFDRSMGFDFSFGLQPNHPEAEELRKCAIGLEEGRSC